MSKRRWRRRLFKAIDEIQDLKQSKDRLKREVRRISTEFNDEIEEMSRDVSPLIAATLSQVPMTDREKETVWGIITNIEQLRGTADGIAGEYKKVQMEVAKMVKEYQESIGAVIKNILLLQESDFKRRQKITSVVGGSSKSADPTGTVRAKQELRAYFFKQGKVRRSWKRRWFWFRKDLSFSYYTAKDERKILDTVDCTDMFMLSADTETQEDFCLKIRTRERVYKILCANEDDLNRWKQDLKLWYKVNTKRMRGGGSLNDRLKRQ